MKITQNFFFLTVVAICMAITNPKKVDYVEYLATHLEDQVCQQEEWAAVQVACQGLAPLVAKPLLSHYTQRQNFIVFSLYTTEMGGIKHRSVGIAGNFFKM